MDTQQAANLQPQTLDAERLRMALRGIYLRALQVAQQEEQEPIHDEDQPDPLGGELMDEVLG